MAESKYKPLSFSTTMRNPERIVFVLNEIKNIWSSYPDLRLCQLLENVKPNKLHDMYYIEDELLVELLHNHYKKGE